MCVTRARVLKRYEYTVYFQNHLKEPKFNTVHKDGHDAIVKKQLNTTTTIMKTLITTFHNRVASNVDKT